jgi:hypothetical protein
MRRTKDGLFLPDPSSAFAGRQTISGRQSLWRLWPHAQGEIQSEMDSADRTSQTPCGTDVYNRRCRPGSAGFCETSRKAPANVFCFCFPPIRRRDFVSPAGKQQSNRPGTGAPGLLLNIEPVEILT